MRCSRILPVLAVSALAFGVAAPLAFAADADHPYKNVDHRNDKGNNTGDSEVDKLNAAQLDENQKGPPPGTPMPAGTQMAPAKQ